MDARTSRVTRDELTGMVAKAKQLEARHHHWWIIIAGSYSGQYIAYPRFRPGFLVAYSLGDLDADLAQVEQAHHMSGSQNPPAQTPGGH